MMMKLDPFPQKIARSSSYCHIQKLPSSGPPFLCLAPILTNFVHFGTKEVETFPTFLLSSVPFTKKETGVGALMTSSDN